MLYLVTCVFSDGLEPAGFRVVEAGSRLEVAQHILDQEDIWSKYLHDAHLYGPIIRGSQPYYATACPVTAEEALRLIDSSRVDGDSRARLSIYPIAEINTVPTDMCVYASTAINSR